MNKEIKGDYKKWLLYSFDKLDFNEHYNLYRSLKEDRDFGEVSIRRSNQFGVEIFVVSHRQISDELEIDLFQKESFKKYLSENYFKTDDVDEVHKQKSAQTDKLKNHNLIETEKISFEDTEIKIHPHPKETSYFNIKLAISFIFYLVLVGLIAYDIVTDLNFLFWLAIVVPIILLLLLFRRMIHGIFIGIIKGNSIQVTKDQFPEIYKIVEEQAKKLKIKKLPEIYITGGHFNAFVTHFSRSNILMIFSEVIETTLTGNYDVLKYVTAHELGHIKQKHLTKRKYLFPSRIVPFLELAYSRGCEYTCDRIGYSFSPKGCAEGILILTTGKEIHSKFNIALHIKNSIENESFWTWLSEKFLTHPHLYKRLVQIKDYSSSFK